MDSSTDKICAVEFKKDGKYTETKDLLLGDYFSPTATWSVKNDSVAVVAKYSNLSVSTYKFSLQQNTCNEIILDLEGLERVKLTRK
jgi:hypothetical protein